MTFEEKKMMGLLKKYAGYHYKVMTKEGFNVDYDELFGELSLTYVEALPNYRKEKGAQFDTYMARAFSYTVSRIKNDIIKRSIVDQKISQVGKRWGLSDEWVEPDDDPEPRRIEEDAMLARDDGAEDMLMVDQALAALKTDKSIDYMVIKDYISPSEKVNDFVRRNRMSLVKAVGAAHRVAPSYVYYQLRLAKRLIKRFIEEGH